MVLVVWFGCISHLSSRGGFWAFILYFDTMCSVYKNGTQIHSPWLHGDIVDSGIGLSYRGPRAHVACRAGTTILMPESTISPKSASSREGMVLGPVSASGPSPPPPRGGGGEPHLTACPRVQRLRHYVAILSVTPNPGLTFVNPPGRYTRGLTGHE